MRRVELISPEDLEALKNHPDVKVVSDMTPIDRLCGIEFTTDFNVFLRANQAEFVRKFSETLFMTPARPADDWPITFR